MRTINALTSHSTTLASEDEMTKRISLEVSDDVYNKLEELKRKRNTTMADVFRRAIGTELFLDQEVQENEKKVLLEDEEGKQQRVVWERI
jgi:predicted CopG family antitoxin